MHDRPRIAINGELSRGDPPKLELPVRYAQAIERAGGVPLAIPPLIESATLDALLEGVDGLVLAGGDDFDMERLGLGPTHAEAKPVPGAKQDFDLALVRQALARGLPTLGICYGMQLLGLAEGGTLFQHLPADRPRAQEHRGGVRHAVRVLPGTKLARFLGVASLPVISRHHQALATAGNRWRVVATDEQGLIEAIEREGDAFALGVQWHPELASPGGVEDRLFAGLVAAARTEPATIPAP